MAYSDIGVFRYVYMNIFSCVPFLLEILTVEANLYDSMLILTCFNVISK